MKLLNYNFRDLYKQCVVLKNKWMFDGAKKMLSDYSYAGSSDMNATLCFGYIDSQAGMSFNFLCFANFETGKIDEKSYEKQLSEKIMLRSRYDAEIEIKPYLGDISVFDERIKMIDEGYHKNEKVLPTRNIKEIDHLRHNIFPDDILVLLKKEGFQIEQVWIRLSGIENGNLVGILLNEPNSDFGVYANQLVHAQIIAKGTDIYVVCLLPK